MIWNICVRIVLILPLFANAGNQSIRLAFLFAFGKSGSKAGQFLQPHDVYISSRGEVFVSDPGNHRIQKFDMNGCYQGETGGFGFNPGQFNSTGGLGQGQGFNILVCDRLNQRFQQYDERLNLVSTFPAGIDPQIKANRGNPLWLAWGPQGDIYFSEQLEHRIIRINSFNETIYRFNEPWSEGFSLKDPQGLVIQDGLVWIADAGDNRIVAFDLNGQFHHILKHASLAYPVDIAADELGYLYVSNPGENSIVVFNKSNGFESEWGRKEHPSLALQSPSGIGYYQNRLYICEQGADRIVVWEKSQ